MRRLSILAVAATVLLAACGGTSASTAASVHDEEIPIEDIEQSLAEFRSTDRYKQLAEQGDVEAIERQFEQGYLATLIRRKVLAPAAAERGIEVTEEDVAEQIEAIKADFPSEQAFQEALKEQALDADALTDLVRDRLIEDALRADVTAETGPSEEEIRAYYEENPDEFRQTRAQHILVEDEALADRLHKQLTTEGEDDVEALFERLAKEHSNDPGSAEQGGDLQFQGAGTFVPPFEEAMNELDIGEISEPVETEFGFHIIRVIDRKTVDFEEAQEQITQQLAGPGQDEQWQEFLAETYKEAEVEVNPRFGEFDPATGEIRDPVAEDVPGGEAPEDAPPADEGGEGVPLEESPAE
ncbi:MAG: peptidylprolyl isomerase [Actinomycetota bacterium]